MIKIRSMVYITNNIINKLSILTGWGYIVELACRHGISAQNTDS